MASVRDVLDAALMGLRSISDGHVNVRDAEREVGAALLHSYRALASAGDAAAYKAESASALARTRGAFQCLGAVRSRDRAVEAEHERLALVIRMLLDDPFPPEVALDLPRPGRGDAVLRASIREPRMINLERPVLFPSVPLPPLEDAEPEAPPQPAAAAPAALATDQDIADLFRKGQEAIAGLAEEPPPKEPEAPAPLGAPDDAALEAESREQ